MPRDIALLPSVIKSVIIFVSGKFSEIGAEINKGASLDSGIKIWCK